MSMYEFVLAPREFPLHDADQLRLIDGLSESDRAVLREAARTGAIEDRAKAVVILARLGDEAARPALAELLNGSRELPVVAAMAYLGPAAERHLDLLTPWLLAMLDPPDPWAFGLAARACGALRLAAAGPSLVALVRAADAASGTSVVTGDAVALLDAMACAWPSREAAEVVREWLARHPDDGGPLGFSPRPLRAMAEIARRGADGDREWAARWCLDWLGSRAYGGNDTAEMSAALAFCGEWVVPLVEQAALTAPEPTGRESVFTALAALDGELAGRFAREHWSRFPRVAVAFLATRHRGTGEPGVVALLEEIAGRVYGIDATCAWALVQVGGPRARQAAERIAGAAAARNSSDPALPGLRSLVAAAAPAREIADEIVRLGLAPAAAADKVVTRMNAPGPALAGPWSLAGLEPGTDAPELRSPHDVLVAVLAEAGHVVRLGFEADDDPPAYDGYLRQFEAASGGAIRLGEVEQTPDDGFVFLTYDHRGERQTEQLSDDPTMYLLELWEFVDGLEPDVEDDPRRFTQMFVNLWVFADPKKLADFAERNGITLE